MAYQPIIVLVLVLGLSECAFVDTLDKCRLNDKECQTKFFQKLIETSAGPGVPELNMSSIDPAIVKNLKVSVLNVFDMTIIEGSAKGIKKSKIHKFKIDMKKKRMYVNVTCDLYVTGTYEVHSDSEPLKALIGGSLDGNGFGGMTVEQLNVIFHFPIEVVKRGNSIFLVGDFKSAKYTFDIFGKLEIKADELYVGGKESSKELLKLMNENWRVLGDSFGKPILDVAMNIVYDHLSTFLDKCSAEHYILDDLTPYVK